MNIVLRIRLHDEDTAVSPHVSLGDTFTLSDDDIKLTRDGYLTASPRVARTGIQTYLGSEVGRPEMARVRVLRPDSEVFSADAAASFANRPLTVGHPPKSVDAKSWKRHAAGFTGEQVIRDGEFVRVPLMFTDAAAIEGIQSKKLRELSAGYDCDLEFTPGVTDDGEAYDAIMRNMVVNHVALVRAGRAGPECRVGDEANEEKRMKVRLKLGDAEHEVDVADADAQHVTALLADRDAVASTVSAKDGEIAALTLRLQEASTALRDAAPDAARLDALVVARTALRVDARRILGDAAALDGKSDAEVRSMAVSAKLGDEAGKKSEAYVHAAFDTLVSMAAKDSKTTGKDPVREALKDGKTVADKADPYTAYLATLGGAWKAPVAKENA